jgi:transmembrane sensor
MMKNTQHDIRKLAAYLSNQLDQVEREDVDRWIHASEENEIFFKECSKVWHRSGLKLAYPTDDTDLHWHELKSRLAEEDGKGKIVALSHRAVLLLKIAASIILLVGISYSFLWLSKSKEIAPSQALTESIEAPAEDHQDNVHFFPSEKQVLLVYLPDSTMVWLNTNSSLSYTDDFGKQQRQVTLKGEGYFNVRHDKEKPFTVITEYANLRVLGTSFNIREDSSHVVLTVAEGSAKLFSNTIVANEVIVKAKERGVCSREGKIRKSKNSDLKFASWRLKNNPVFEREKLTPTAFLHTSYKWRKNAINQSVVEGTIDNSAMLASYKNMVLKITYTKFNGKLTTVRVTVNETVKPGETIHFHKRLLDIFSDTRSLNVQVLSVEIAQPFK